MHPFQERSCRRPPASVLPDSCFSYLLSLQDSGEIAECRGFAFDGGLGASIRALRNDSNLEAFYLFSIILCQLLIMPPFSFFIVCAARDTIGTWTASVREYNLENNRGQFQDNRPELTPNDTFVAGQTLAVGEC